MKNGVFSCGESKRLLKRSFIGKRSAKGCEKLNNIGFLTFIYPKCTTAKSKLAVKATALVKNEILKRRKTCPKSVQTNRYARNK